MSREDTGRGNRRRLRVEGGSRAKLVGAIAEAIGIDVSYDDEWAVDLSVVEADDPRSIEAHARRQIPLMVLATRRLRDAESASFRRAGARWVLDGDASVLDVAFALSESLFQTIGEQRRYWRHLGGTSVEILRLDTSHTHAARAQLLGIAREGGYLRTSDRAPEGTPIEIVLSLDETIARIRARVAYVAEDGFAVEFALDDQHVAPRIAELFAASERGSSKPRDGRAQKRTESGAELS